MFEIGVMFTATGDLPGTLAQLQKLGFRHGQIAVPENLDLDVARTRQEIEEASFTLSTLFGVYEGESYADIPTVRRTVGFVPLETRERRLARTCDLIDSAAALGIPGFATHLGMIPEDRLDPTYVQMVEVTRGIADRAAKHEMTFALETGQETAHELLDFILEVNRENLGINFDPANMILYGTGSPIEALDLLGQHVLTVHCKDGIWPSAAAPQSLGTEMPLGQGKVDFRAFLTLLAKFGYAKPLFIERESENADERLKDLTSGKTFLEMLGAET